MKLLIFGAGGHGQVCKEIAEMQGIYDQIEFIDDNKKNKDVVASFKEFKDDINKYKNEYDSVFIGLGNFKKRYELIKIFKDYHFNVCNLISSNAFISKSAKIGIGIFISHGVLINANTNIEDYCVFGLGSMVDHNANVEMNSYIHAGQIVEANSNYPIRTTDDIKVNLNICTFDE